MACSSNASLVSQTPDSEGMDADQKYGWGRFKPSFLQRLHGAKFLLVCISLCGVTQGMLINGLIPVSLSSLERRFSLGSFQSGLLVSAYDVAVLLCLVPCTHFGGSGHKGRWLGIGMLIMALGSFVFVLPQVLSGPYSGYKANDTSHALCGADVDASVANTSFESNALYYALLLIGNFLHGVGATPLFTLGVTFLDESVTHEMSPLYLGIFMGSALFGPVLGFGGGGALLRANGDWLKQDPPANISPDDPQWYGAWWLGFLLGGLMALVSGVLMLGFARRLPDAPEQKVEVTTHMKIATSKEQFVTGVKAIFNSTTFLFLCIVDVLESLLSTGVVSFFPKIVQSFFNMSASTASLVTGGAIVPAAVFGNILGGSLSKKFKWNATGMILFAIIVESSSLIFGGCFLFHCPRSEIIGVDRDANFTSFSRFMPSVTMARMEHTLNNTCNNRCSCDGSIYQPVCDTKENVAYFSPCYAGCTDSVNNKYYSNCKCLSRTKDEPSTSTTVKDGLCGDGCFWMYPFFVLFACYVCVAFSSAIPIQESELRSVPFDQRSLAFGIRWIFIRLLGTIPAPLLFGVFVDKACVVWKVDQNNKHLDCPLYNNAFLSTFIVVCGTALKVLVVISLGLAWHFSRKASKVTPETYHEEQETGAAADQQCPSPKLNERF